jgi:uncharacterized protein (TIGR02147 family)
VDCVFDFHDYKEYLAWRIPTQGAERGNRARLAEKLKCQPAFVSQVLSGKPNFSLEHAVAIDDFLSHTEEESRYFMLLVHQGRAGTEALRRYYASQLDALKNVRAKVASRVPTKQTLSVDASHRYYSSWYYSAIHVLVLVPGFDEKKAIAERLNLPLSTVTEALSFLVQEGLIEEKAGKYSATSRRVHLTDDSSMIYKHHTNWRIRSLNALDVKDPVNLHYSGPIAISAKNAQVFRARLLTLIAELEPVLAEPNEEDLYGIALDLFRV